MKKCIVIIILFLLCVLSGVLVFTISQSKTTNKNTTTTSTIEPTSELTTVKQSESTTRKTEGTTNKVTTKSTTKKSTKSTTKVTTKSTTRKSTTKKTTTRKPTTTRVTTVEQKCTPMTKLPEGAVWYAEWGPDEPLDFGDWDAYYKKVDPTQKLLDIAWDIHYSLGYGRTDGGLYYISCANDTFSLYGAYFEINGYFRPLDENGNRLPREQIAKGYMRPDGSVKWLYKNY